jgi:hypothetical protein
MGTDTMGTVAVRIKLQNEADLERALLRELPAQDVREVEIDDALVDTGAIMLAVPGRVVRELGLTRKRVKDVQTTNGRVQRTIYGGVRLTIQDRDFLCEVAELPDDAPRSSARFRSKAWTSSSIRSAGG